MTDFRQPKLGSAYAIWINEGCSYALMGLTKRNPYFGIEAEAYDYGYATGIAHIKGLT
jgi:hypothetical protein